jgi:hypothetical protein
VAWKCGGKQYADPAPLLDRQNRGMLRADLVEDETQVHRRLF